MMLTVLSGLAEFERELIRARTDEGTSSRQGEWHPHGRPSKLNAHQRQEAIARREPANRCPSSLARMASRTLRSRGCKAEELSDP